MSRVSNTLTMFVSGVDNHGQEGVTDPSMAWGLFYDSTRWATYSTAMSPEGLEQDAACALTAVFYGITHAILRAPRYYNLVVETDNSIAATLINDAMHSRSKGAQRPSSAEDKEWRLVGRILDLIEQRTKRGDFFVDVIFSGNDPSAKRGLMFARNMALKALNKGT